MYIYIYIINSNSNRAFKSVEKPQKPYKSKLSVLCVHVNILLKRVVKRCIYQQDELKLKK